MGRLLKAISALLLIVAIFSAGTFFGSYYHNELSVIWRGLKQQPPSPEPAVLAGQSETELKNLINLPGLNDPMPLIFSDTLEEEKIQAMLKEGAVVLPLGTSFGDPGNVVVTAHSSGTEAFGPYRFAFAKLSELKEGDEYTVQTPKALYTYRVYGQEVVWPHEVDKLPNDDRSTITLVTCWPIWTNFKRLLVHSELVNTQYNI